MADEPMNLEAPPVIETLPSEPVVETPADPDEADAVDLPAGKHVPLTALKAVRDENKTLREKAGRVEQLERELADARPYRDFVNQNPQLRQPAAPPVPASTEADPKLSRIARSLDFYTSDGKPDLDRARAHQALIREEAAEIAQQNIAPLAQRQFQDAASANWARAASVKLPDGRPIDVSLLTTAWQAVAAKNPSVLADPMSVRVITNSVAMEQMMSAPMGTQPPVPRSPVVSEGAGRPPTTRGRMTEAERELLTGRNIDDGKFGDLTRGFQQGRGNALED